MREAHRRYEFGRARSLAFYRIALLESLIEKAQIDEAKKQMRRLEGHIGKMKALEGNQQ